MLGGVARNDQRESTRMAVAMHGNQRRVPSVAAVANKEDEDRWGCSGREFSASVTEETRAHALARPARRFLSDRPGNLGSAGLREKRSSHPVDRREREYAMREWRGW